MPLTSEQQTAFVIFANTHGLSGASYMLAQKGFELGCGLGSPAVQVEQDRPKFDEFEFAAMVEKGTKAWAGVPDNWLEIERGNEPEPQDGHVIPPSRAEPAVQRDSDIMAELDFLGEWLTMASEPIGVQCCGRAIGPECCGNPEPDYVHPKEVIDAMQARHKALTGELFEGTLPPGTGGEQNTTDAEILARAEPASQRDAPRPALSMFATMDDYNAALALHNAEQDPKGQP